MNTKPDLGTVRSWCTQFLSHHLPKTPQKELLELAEFAGASTTADVYGTGELINGFEQEIARLLGKEAAVFMPSGTMAQQIALRIWSQRVRSTSVAFHPRCHLELHENKGYQMLHGLHGALVGSPERLMTADDLKKVVEPLAALVIELPQREIGGQLPCWEELNAIVTWARAHGIPTHLDGARLWECKPFYAKEYAQIANLFDTVYVSFYKGLGGISGAALAGPADLIAESRIWMRRHGGNLKSLYPYVLAARKGLQEHLDQMGRYHDCAVEIARTLSTFEDVEIIPNPPHTNMFHVYLHGSRERLEQAALEVARERGKFLFYQLNPSQIPSYHYFEVTAGTAALQWTQDEIREAFDLLLKKARI